MWIVMPTASLKAKYLSQKLLLMKKSEECFIGNCIYPAKLFIKNLFAKGSVVNRNNRIFFIISFLNKNYFKIDTARF